MSERDPITDEMTAGPNDFPYWSDDNEEAHDFGSDLLAKNEMEFNDLTSGGTREPVIVNI